MGHWDRAFRKLWRASGQAAEDKVDEHTDPTISLELAIGEAQKNAETLKANASKVIANQEMAKMRLAKAQKNVDLATANTKAAVDAENRLRTAGNGTEADRAHEQAVMMATTLAHAREALETAKHLCEMADAAAVTAHQRIEEEMEALNEMMARRSEIQGKIDQAKMEKAMNESLSALTSASTSITPTLDQVEERAESMIANAHATSDIQSEDPSILALDVHRQAVHNEAEDILAELNRGADQPALNS